MQVNKTKACLSCLLTTVLVTLLLYFSPLIYIPGHTAVMSLINILLVLSLSLFICSATLWLIEFREALSSDNVKD